MDLTPAAAVERIIAARYAPVPLSPLLEPLLGAAMRGNAAGEPAAADERWRLLAQLDHLQLQLRRYGRHQGRCPGAAGSACDCGLDAALQLAARSAVGEPVDTDRLNAITWHEWAVLLTSYGQWQVELSTGDTVTRADLREALDAAIEVERTGRGADVAADEVMATGEQADDHRV